MFSPAFASTRISTLAGKLLSRNAERHLKSDAEMRALFRDRPDAIENTGRLADRLEFSLENIGYEFPAFPVPDGHDMDSFLRTITSLWRAAALRGDQHRGEATARGGIAPDPKLGFSGYFLIVWDIINFCREHNVMVQGRGSAANSAVCYCLGITPVDPVSNHLVFERFLSESRKGWPDIDLDLPSGDRRESVIQEVYRRYGKHGAAMTANVITYRGRSAAREIGKALNFSPNILDRFSHLFAQRRFSAHARSGSADRAGRFAESASAHAGFHFVLSGNLRIAAPSRAAFRRDDYLPGKTEFLCAAGKCLDARPRRGAMGQG